MMRAGIQVNKQPDNQKVHRLVINIQNQARILLLFAGKGRVKPGGAEIHAVD